MCLVKVLFSKRQVPRLNLVDLSRFDVPEIFHAKIETGHHVAKNPRGP